MPTRVEPARGPVSLAAPGGYAEHPPSTALRPFVQCFWTREPGPATSAPTAHRVLPDGCIDIVLGFTSTGGGVPESVQAVGTMTRALVVDAVSDESFVGVRFRPAKAVGLLRLPASELTDLSVPLDDLWGDATAVADAFADAAGSAARVGVLDHVLRARFEHAARVDHRDVDEAVRRIVAAGGSLGITRLAPALRSGPSHGRVPRADGVDPGGLVEDAARRVIRGMTRGSILPRRRRRPRVASSARIGAAPGGRRGNPMERWIDNGVQHDEETQPGDHGGRDRTVYPILGATRIHEDGGSARG